MVLLTIGLRHVEIACLLTRDVNRCKTAYQAPSAMGIARSGRRALKERGALRGFEVLDGHTWEASAT